PSSTATPSEGCTFTVRAPLGPLTSTTPGVPALTSTPLGRRMGLRPTRDISPHLADDLAAHVLGAGLAVGEEPQGGGDDGEAQPAAHDGHALRLGVGATARLRDAADRADHALALRPVLQADAQDALAALLHLLDVLEVALADEDLGQGLLELARR